MYHHELNLHEKEKQKMTERLKTLNAIRNDICRKLRELEAKKEAYNLPVSGKKF
jgi:hypothetical protein